MKVCAWIKFKWQVIKNIKQSHLISDYECNHLWYISVQEEEDDQNKEDEEEEEELPLFLYRYLHSLWSTIIQSVIRIRISNS